MPELPEVETTLRGIQPHLSGQIIQEIIVRNPSLRWPVPPQVHEVAGQPLNELTRRAKYLLFSTQRGHLIWHLGMSGSMRVLPRQSPASPHEHIQMNLHNGLSLRYIDPRRFGCLLYTEDSPLLHPLLEHLGPEPLSDAFNAEYLFAACGNRKVSIKQLIMQSSVVVGVGNIYACESLFVSGIHPKRQASRISKQRLAGLVAAIKQVLEAAILQGGTTLRDFTGSDGKPGYFVQSLHVYDRENKPCDHCGKPIKRITLGQRSTYYCTQCQS